MHFARVITSLLLLLSIHSLRGQGLVKNQFFSLEKSEACRGDDPFLLSGYKIDSLKTPLPPGGVFAIESCIKEPCATDGIFYVDSLGLYFFNPNVAEDSYVISYTLGTFPIDTVYLAQLDIQAANSQIITTDNGVCPDDILILQANPQGGTFRGAGLDSLLIGAQYNYFFNPTGLVQDSTYRIDYDYFLTAASGLICRDSSYVEIAIYKETAISLSQDSITACRLTEVELGVEIENEDLVADLTWFNNKLEILSKEPSFTMDTISTSGDYFIFATDINGCEDFFTVYIEIINPPVMNCRLTTPIDCYGHNNATVTVETEEAEVLDFLWSDGNTSQVRNNLSAGIYNLTATNNFGCVSSCEITIKQPEDLEIDCTENIISPLCHNGSDGSNEIIITGGSGPFRVSLDSLTFSNHTTIENLRSGSHTVYIVDNNDCTAACRFSVPETEKDSCQINLLSEVSCYGLSDASIALESNLDLGSSTIAWNTGDNSAVLENLSTGTYIATITNRDNCVISCQTTLSSPEFLYIESFSSSNPNCFNGTDGIINFIAKGGTPPYVYALNDSLINSSGRYSNLLSGNYSLSIKDANGCETHTSHTLIDPDSIFAEIAIVQKLFCFGDTQGHLTVFNQNQEVDYLWSTGSTSREVDNLSTGNYSVTLTNDNGCEKVLHYDLEDPPLLQHQLEFIEHNECHGEAAGNIIVSATGGTPPYNYQWNNGLNTPSIENLTAGLYAVTITDESDCIHIADFEITEPILTEASFELRPPSCSDSQDGYLQLTISPPSPEVQYLWSTGDTTAQLHLGAGSFSVTVTTGQNCQSIFHTTVDAPLPLEINTTPVPVVCYGAATGQINLNVEGGTQPYTIRWADESTEPFRTNLSEGNYEVTVTDNNNCTQTAAVGLLGPEPTILTINQLQPHCYGAQSGDLNLTTNADLSTSIINWDDGSNLASRSNLSAGNYSVSLTDTDGCLTTASVTLEEPMALDLAVLSQDHIDCYGETSGALELSVSGGTEPYQVYWDDGATGLSRPHLSAGDYAVTVVDAQGCLLSNTYTLHQAQDFYLQATDAHSCLDEEIPITFDVTGRHPEALSYHWSVVSQNLNLPQDIIRESHNNTVTIDAYNLPPGTVTITCETLDPNGCQASFSIDLTLENCFDLALRKQVQGAELKSPTDPFIFEIEIINQGSITAYDLIIEDRYDEELIFIQSKNEVATTGNPANWTGGLSDLVTTTIDSILPGETKRLFIYFDLVDSPQKTTFCNEAEIISYASKNKLLPLDQDDPVLLPNAEIDDDISDDYDGGIDNPYDDDQRDKAIARICPRQMRTLELQQCGLPETNIFFDLELRSQLDPDGDGDGDSTDGDNGNLISSFHLTQQEALSNSDPLTEMEMDYSRITVYGRLMTQEGCASAMELILELFEIPSPIILDKEIYAAIGDTVTLSVDAKMNESYQWQEKINGVFVDLLGGTSHQISIPVDSSNQNETEFRVINTLDHQTTSCAENSSIIKLIIPSTPPVCKNRLNVSLDNYCDLYLTPSQLIVSSYTDDIFEICYKDIYGQTVTDNWQNHIEDGLIFTVTNTLNGYSCWGNLSLRDTSPPSLYCPSDLTIDCTSTLDLGLFTTEDNCGEEIVLSSYRHQVERSCDFGMDNIASQQVVQIIATDSYGNQSRVCSTTIHYAAPYIDSLGIPQDTILSGILWDHNQSNYPEPEESGLIVYDSIFFSPDSLIQPCQLQINYEDVFIEVTEDNYFIERTWFIQNFCTGITRIENQTITVIGNSIKGSSEGSLKLRHSSNRDGKESFDELTCTVAPNPFDSHTVIHLDLDHKQNIHLALYDVRGKCHYNDTRLLVKGNHQLQLESELFTDETSLYMLVITSEKTRKTIPIIRCR